MINRVVEIIPFRDMGEEPLLTVAIPTFNCAHFLPDTLASIMRQGLDDFEILIIDNASEDNTEEVVGSFRNKRIRYLRNPSNLGSRENGNRCLTNARGRYIKFVCADDVLLDGVLAKQLRILESHAEVALVTCNNFVTDANLRINGSYCAAPGLQSGARVINLCLSRVGNCIGGPSNTMFRRAVAQGIAADPSFHLLSDLKFYLQILERGAYANIDEFGYLYRQHSGSDIALNCPPEIHMPESLRLVSEFDWWNPLNCVVASLSGGPEGWRQAREHWREALGPIRIARSVQASADLLYKRWSRFVREQKLGHANSENGSLSLSATR